MRESSKLLTSAAAAALVAVLAVGCSASGTANPSGTSSSSSSGSDSWSVAGGSSSKASGSGGNQSTDGGTVGAVGDAGETVQDAGTDAQDASGTPLSGTLDAGQTTSPPPVTTYGPVYNGTSGYITSKSPNACGFSIASSDNLVAAVNSTQFANMAMCGECIIVKGPKGSVTVRVTDECEGCPSGNINIYESAFASIANVSDGIVSVTWQATTCPSK